QWSLIQQHFGARRFAYNWAVAEVKANLDARAADPSVPALAWTLPTLRKAWNQAKSEVAPWWGTVPRKPRFRDRRPGRRPTRLVDIQAWPSSRRQNRVSRFKARHRSRGRVRFTTGTMPLEPARPHLPLPVIGRLRCKENTRRLERL